jgi:hypothetical protein
MRNCKAGENGSYCVEANSDSDPNYAVSCVNGAATVLECGTGCGSSGDSAYLCDD